MDLLQILTYNGINVRITELDGEPWFVGKDVADILGYANSYDAIITHVDEDDRRIVHRSEVTTFNVPNRGLIVINEPGLYSLILFSHLPGASKFRRWITKEVLPSIRKNGIYATPITIDRIVNDPDLGIRLLTEQKEERERRVGRDRTSAIPRLGCGFHP